jgi:deoxyribonuclease V
MQVHHRHDWNVSAQEAVDIQKRLAGELVTDAPLDFGAVEYVAGVDVSVKDNISQAAVVVMTYPHLEPIETATAKMPTPFPYIPGLLTFREGPVLVDAFEQLQHEPDVFVFDGMGRIHPRRMGIAAHMGLWLQRPTIGVGKTHLIGEYDQPGTEKGSYSWITDKGETIGALLRTRANVKPVYVSVGHMGELTNTVEFVLKCSPKYRLPRPIRLAHKAAGKR